jgi:hypothetical protein
MLWWYELPKGLRLNVGPAGIERSEPLNTQIAVRGAPDDDGEVDPMAEDPRARSGGRFRPSHPPTSPWRHPIANAGITKLI